ncbi:MAG: hypothetical protein IJ862_00135 [Selenomonadaceae bacterium]|nr:hypothetical protein [Selenomonadaceae bacterium]
MIKSWFVSQGKSYEAECKGGFLVAPRCRQDGAERSYWTNITRVNKGDLIIHYAAGLRAVGQVSEKCHEISIPEDTAQQNDWSNQGWQLKCDYTELKRVLKLSQFKDDILKYGREELSAFNINGNVKQGYLFELNPTLANIFLQKMLSQSPELAELQYLKDFLAQDLNSAPPEVKTQKTKSEKPPIKEKMTNQMLSNLERLMALHESTHLVKPASLTANLPARFKKQIIVDDKVIPKETVQELVDTKMRKYLEEEFVSEDEVYDMRFIDYSEKTFGIEVPLLLRVKALTYDDSPKYFSNPVTIRGSKFYLCSAWTEDQRDKLEVWLDKVEAVANALPEYKDIKIRDLAKNVLRDLLMAGKADDAEVEKMLTLDYSSDTFGINYPLLVTERNQSNVANYFKLKVPIRGVTYYLCSQWFEQPKNNDRPQLEKWIKEHRD